MRPLYASSSRHCNTKNAQTCNFSAEKFANVHFFYYLCRLFVCAQVFAHARTTHCTMKIALIGYGKMGRMIESVALSRGHEIVCIIDPLTSPQTFDSPAFRSADVAIEFTRPEAAEQNVRAALAQGVPVVSGTTGWDVEGLKATLNAPYGEADRSTVGRKEPSLNPPLLSDGELPRLGNSNGKSSGERRSDPDRGQGVGLPPGVIWSSNYSIGVNILFAVNKYLAQLLHNTGGYQPSITEVHHIHKLDAPSGTAKTLQEAINSQPSPLNCPITSIREGEVPGIHEVRWESEADILTLRHEAKSRQGFALGAVLAAEWLRGKTGWHSMTEVLGLEK